MLVSRCGSRPIQSSVNWMCSCVHGGLYEYACVYMFTPVSASRMVYSTLQCTLQHTLQCSPQHTLQHMLQHTRQPIAVLMNACDICQVDTARLNLQNASEAASLSNCMHEQRILYAHDVAFQKTPAFARQLLAAISSDNMQQLLKLLALTGTNSQKSSCFQIYNTA